MCVTKPSREGSSGRASFCTIKSFQGVGLLRHFFGVCVRRTKKMHWTSSPSGGFHWQPVTLWWSYLLDDVGGSKVVSSVFFMWMMANCLAQPSMCCEFNADAYQNKPKKNILTVKNNLNNWSKIWHYSTTNTSWKEVLDIFISTKGHIYSYFKIAPSSTTNSLSNKKVVDSSYVVVFQSGQGLGSL